jgi:hypothetical protein
LVNALDPCRLVRPVKEVDQLHILAASIGPCQLAWQVKKVLRL